MSNSKRTANMTNTIHSYLDRGKALDEAKRVRLRLLEQGYSPLPAKQKQVLLKGWPQIKADEETIEKWSRKSDYRTTAIRIEGDLVAIDIDVNHAGLVEEILKALDDINVDVTRWAPMRSGSGEKLMLLCRCPEEKVGVIQSRSMQEREGVDEPRHRVEVFGGATTRYFTCFGPHTEGRVTAKGVEVRVMYDWEDGISPLDLKPAQLPVVTRKQLIDLCQRATDIMEQAGWTPVLNTKSGEVAEQHVDDLTEDMRFDMFDGSQATLEDLGSYAGERCSASWTGDPACRNRSRCMVDVDHDGRVRLLDFDTYVWHYPEGTDLRPRTARLGSENRKKLSALADALTSDGYAFTGLNTSYEAPKSAVQRGKRTEGGAYEEWAFIDWLLTRYAFYPTGNTGEQVIDLETGARMGLGAFDVMWASKVWHEETGEEFTKGPRAGEAKTEKVVPTKVWQAHKDRITLSGFQFDPRTEQRLIEDRHGNLRYNSYRAPEEITDQPVGRAQDWWEDFLRHLLPEDEERLWFINWLRYKYRNPWERGQGVLMLSEDGGAGRGVMFSVLRAVFEHHVKKVPAYRLIGLGGQSQFNEWANERVLIFVDELLAEGGSFEAKRRSYEVLKDRLDPAASEIDVNAKGMREYAATAYYSVIMATNNDDALPLASTDRRITVLQNGEALKGSLLRRYVDLLDRGAVSREMVAGIRAWMLEGDVDAGAFMAPLATAAKAEMMTNNEGLIEQVLRQQLDRLERSGKCIVRFEDLVELVEKEVRAQGGSVMMVTAVKGAIRKVTKAGIAGWKNLGRRKLRVAVDPDDEQSETEPLRNLVVLGTTWEHLTPVDRAKHTH